MNAGVHPLVIIIVLCLSVTNGSCRVIYVTPEKEHSCPHNTQLCYTLSHIAENPMNYFSSNTKIIFLPGNHTTDTNRSIVIANVSNITLEGSGSTIQCIKGRELGFVFIRVTILSITNIHLYHCGAVLPLEVQLKIYKPTVYLNLYHHTSDFYTKSSPALYLIQVTDITIFRISIYNSTGPGLMGVNILGHSIISQSSFVRNNPNCAFLFKDTISFTPVLPAKLFMIGLQVMFGKSSYNYNEIQFAAGLNTILAQTSYKVLLNIINMTAYANDGFYYGNVFFYMTNCNKINVEIYLHRINCSYSNYIGLALEIGYRFRNCRSKVFLQHSIHTMFISQSYFGKNAHAVHIIRTGLELGHITNNETAAIANTTFHSNSLVLKLIDFYAVNLINVRFTHNIAETGDSNAPIQIQDSSIRFQGNTTFLRNRGETAGAIYVRTSQLYFEGNVQFVENEGYDGGAIALYEQSKMILNNSVSIAHDFNVTFTRNRARHYGGAIYIGKIKANLDCCYSLQRWPTVNTTVLMVFTNNTSGFAGSTIYGGWINLCYYLSENSPIISTVTGRVFKEIFQINTDSSDLSPVSSEPVRVCICSDSKPVCNITYHTVKAYPGETFQISAVGVGQMYGTVPSTIQAEFRQTNTTIQPNLESLQQVQKVEQFCSYLSYTIKSSNPVEEIILTVQPNIDNEVLDERNMFGSIFPEKQFHNVVIHIDLEICPLAFVIDNKVCICHPQLQTLGIRCNLTTGRVYKDAQVWVNATFHEGVLTGVIVHQNHPFDYCRPHNLNLSLENPDEQCAFHRSGILCGACQHNLSHVLGSSNCKQCSSLWSILLIPIFAIAGIVLVIFLMILNLTVSVGTINGLIFYANIVRANQAAFFPHNINNSFLSWFIAWMNLDLGFEACFYNGMDAYAKTWLQFVFPVYIWFIVILIIVSSHYYTTAAKLASNKAVQVLATLFLLSYAKLLRLTITIFSSTTLEYPDGSIRRVWLYDGNVDYLKGKHIPLFMAAMVVLLVLSLPYTALLLFIQCLQQKTKYRVLFWIGKFKPLFDTYTGPYKDKHRYWTGLLLLVRAILFLTFSANAFGDPAINLLATAAMMFSLFIYVAISQHIYRNKILNMLEYSFFFNLGITCMGSLYIKLATRDQRALTYTSVGIAFVTFCVVMLHHTVIRIKTLSERNPCCQLITTRMNGLELKTNSQQQNQNQETHQATHTTHPPGNPQVPITFIELREPLLEYCSNN